MLINSTIVNLQMTSQEPPQKESAMEDMGISLQEDTSVSDHQGSKTEDIVAGEIATTMERGKGLREGAARDGEGEGDEAQMFGRKCKEKDSIVCDDIDDDIGSSGRKSKVIENTGKESLRGVGVEELVESATVVEVMAGHVSDNTRHENVLLKNTVDNKMEVTEDILVETNSVEAESGISSEPRDKGNREVANLEGKQELSATSESFHKIENVMEVAPEVTGLVSEISDYVMEKSCDEIAFDEKDVFEMNNVVVNAKVSGMADSVLNEIGSDITESVIDSKLELETSAAILKEDYSEMAESVTQEASVITTESVTGVTQFGVINSMGQDDPFKVDGWMMSEDIEPFLSAASSVIVKESREGMELSRERDGSVTEIEMESSVSRVMSSEIPGSVVTNEDISEVMFNGVKPRMSGSANTYEELTQVMGDEVKPETAQPVVDKLPPETTESGEEVASDTPESVVDYLLSEMSESVITRVPPEMTKSVVEVVPSEITESVEEVTSEMTESVINRVPPEMTKSVVEVVPSEITESVEEVTSEMTELILEELPFETTESVEEVPFETTESVVEEVLSESTKSVEEVPSEITESVVKEVPSEPTESVAEEVPSEKTKSVVKEVPPEPTESVVEEVPSETTESLVEEDHLNQQNQS